MSYNTEVINGMTNTIANKVQFRGSKLRAELQEKFPDKVFPEKVGVRWLLAEEAQLLMELKSGLSITDIAVIHKRTESAIQSRRKEIAYKLYEKKFAMENIIQQTLLDEDTIQQVIYEKTLYTPQGAATAAATATATTTVPLQKTPAIEAELAEIKKELKEMKHLLLTLTSQR